jgi:hypothetical protein
MRNNYTATSNVCGNASKATLECWLTGMIAMGILEVSELRRYDVGSLD